MRTYFYLDSEKTKPVYLVQRMKDQFPGSDKPGLDRFFSFDYMGSAEFEFGALPTSVRAMRAAEYDKLKPVLIKVKADEVTNPRSAEHKEFKAYYLGPSEWINSVREFFRTELEEENKNCLKEVTQIADAYCLSRWPRARDDCKIIGWLDIKNHWCLFKTEKHANRFLEGLRTPKKDAA